jgi:predicted transcriptional regulator
MKTRIEIHLTPEEVAKLDAIAKADGRSRKNLCETEIRKLIKRVGKKK